MNKKKLVIPEIESPKIYTLAVKVSAEEKEIIEEYCESKKYRVSPFLRVTALQKIMDEMGDKNEG